MTINSPVFLFCFLPLVFLLSRIKRDNTRYANILLAAAGLVFYAFGRPGDVPVLLLSAAANRLFGLWIIRKPENGKTAAAVAAVFNIGLLCGYKFFAAALPLGISFFTFSGLSYVIDTERDKENGTEDFLKLFLYISFFPKLIAGPIVKYRDMSPQIDARICSPDMTEAGIMRFIRGLGKKIIIAGTLGCLVDGCFASAASDSRLAWLVAVCYSLQIYYDFSGYSDMAIGLASMFGFSFAENFNHPYASSSIKEFWRRWHISLSSWFRDYLYIPLGGNRKGKARTVLNKMAVFLATGLWHGAGWTFIFWGLGHGLLASLEDFLPMDKFKKSRAGNILCRVYTLLAVMLLFVIFRADSLAQGFGVIGAMFSFGRASAGVLIARFLTPAVIVMMILGIALSGDAVERIKLKKVPARALSIALLLLCIFAMAKNSTVPFIYAQF